MTTLAFAGAGRIASVHALAAQGVADLAVTAVASRSPDRAGALAKELRAAMSTYADLPAGADVVFVCTPPAQHTDLAIQVLQAGAAVIVEKPLATTLDEADRLVAAAAACGGRLGYAENLAFAPAVLELRRRRGALGPLQHLSVRALQERPTWGDFLHASWGGGVLFDLGPHPLALVLLVASPSRPVSVACRLEGAPDIAADEHASLSVTFDDGLVAGVEVSWREPAASAVWDLQAASATGVLRLELIPAVALEHDGEPVALPTPDRRLAAPQLEQMGYVGQLRRFARDLTAGHEPEMGASFGRAVLDVICAASASAARDGEPVPLPFTGPRDRTPLQLWRG